MNTMKKKASPAAKAAKEQAEIPNETTIAAIEAAERGEDMLGPFDTVDELMAELIK